MVQSRSLYKYLLVKYCPKYLEDRYFAIYDTIQPLSVPVFNIYPALYVISIANWYINNSKHTIPVPVKGFQSTFKLGLLFTYFNYLHVVHLNYLYVLSTDDHSNIHIIHIPSTVLGTSILKPSVLVFRTDFHTDLYNIHNILHTSYCVGIFNFEATRSNISSVFARQFWMFLEWAHHSSPWWGSALMQCFFTSSCCSSVPCVSSNL